MTNQPVLVAPIGSLSRLSSFSASAIIIINEGNHASKAIDKRNKPVKSMLEPVLYSRVMQTTGLRTTYAK